MSRLAKIKARAETLDDLYALIPVAEGCDGSCWESCGPITFSLEEGARMTAAGVTVPNRNHKTRAEVRAFVAAQPDDLMCEALDEAKRCRVYGSRPMVCRLWGAASGLPCMAQTCRLTSPPLTDDEGFLMMRRAMEIGGWPGENREHHADAARG